MRTLLRIAVAGAGWMGRRHIDVLVRSRECKLSAIVDPASAAAGLAIKAEVPHFASLAELFARDLPDGVILVTPNQLHVG